MFKFNILFLLSFLFLISCTKNEDKIKNEEARDLFRESAETIKEFTELISYAVKIDEIDSIQFIFEKKINDINFSFSPETDLKLTEQENDSLFKLLEEMKNVTQRKMKILTDTINSSIEPENTEFL